ncbi:hypothetical protein FRC12_018080 [Ceratobasidium sp. 428]|nr:hypothetical protein FRC12_018080 [Ceratobasidium sp. 428]
MRGRRGRHGGWPWWHRGDKSKNKRRRGHSSLETGEQDQDVEDESFEIVNAPSHPPPPPPPPPPHGEFPPPPPPPPGRHVPPPPPPPRPHHHVHAPIIITLRVPSTKLPALRTRLPWFTHDFDLVGSSPSRDLLSSIPSLGGLDLATRDASIGLGSVVVREGGNVTVKSSNAPIRGDVDVKDGWALLETRNAVVDVNVKLGGNAGEVELRSSNAPIVASLALAGSGRFTASCATSNAHLAVNVTSQPEGARLFFTGRTSNAPTSVQLHPNYEGTFELTSSVVAPGVVISEIEGRKVEFERDGGRVVGSVWYEGDEEVMKREGGEVVVSTSNAPNTLLL